MKKILVIIVSFVSICVSAQEKNSSVNWMSFSQAVKAQKKEQKKIIMDIYTTWCGPCKMLEKNTFSDPEVSKYINDNYYAVKFNAEGNEVINYKGTIYKNDNYVAEKKGRGATHPFASIGATNGRLAYPTIVLLDEKLDLITPFVGYKTPQQLNPILHFFIESEDLNQESFNNYIKNYKQ